MQLQQWRDVALCKAAIRCRGFSKGYLMSAIAKAHPLAGSHDQSGCGFAVSLTTLDRYRARRALFHQRVADLGNRYQRELVNKVIYYGVIAPIAKRKANGKFRPVRELPVPEGAMFLNQHFSCAAGARRYRLYIPSTAGEGLQGLIVMLHGCTQEPEDFAAGTRMNAMAEERRLLVVYPAQTIGANCLSAWNWFRPGDQMRDAGEPAIIAGLTKSLRDQYAIPEDRVFVAGLSAGGAMAAVMGETYPDLYRAIGVHSGLAYGAAESAISALTAMRGQADRDPVPSPDLAGELEPGPRMIVFHGSADRTVHPLNADRIVAGKIGAEPRIWQTEVAAGESRGHTRLAVESEDGTHDLEFWMIEGGEHAWSGGDESGSYTDPQGPDASAAMVHFFLDGASEPPGV